MSFFSVTIKWKQVFIKLNFKNIIHREYWLEVETYCQFNLIFSVYQNIFLTNLSLTVVNDAHINFSLLVSVENTSSEVQSKSLSKGYDVSRNLSHCDHSITTTTTTTTTNHQQSIFIASNERVRVSGDRSVLRWSLMSASFCSYFCVCWESGA